MGEMAPGVPLKGAKTYFCFFSVFNATWPFGHLFCTDFYHFGRPFVKGSPYAIGRLYCLSCVSVTLVYDHETVGRIKMKLGTEVGL